jgi:hypothetical protein
MDGAGLAIPDSQTEDYQVKQTILLAIATLIFASAAHAQADLDRIVATPNLDVICQRTTLILDQIGIWRQLEASASTEERKERFRQFIRQDEQRLFVAGRTEAGSAGILLSGPIQIKLYAENELNGNKVMRAMIDVPGRPAVDGVVDLPAGVFPATYSPLVAGLCPLMNGRGVQAAAKMLLNEMIK